MCICSGRCFVNDNLESKIIPKNYPLMDFLYLRKKCIKKDIPVSMIHNKVNKQLINSYRPIILLPVCPAMFEKSV